MKPVVAKYGGTSIAHIQATLGVISANPHQKVIVVSAPGKTQPTDKKTTDLLLGYADQKDADTLALLIERYRAIGASDDILKEIQSAVSGSDDHSYIVSRGEYFAGKIVAQATGSTFVDASELFRFKRDGKLDFATTKTLVKKLLHDSSKSVVVPGFYGADGAGKIYLFGRGGSDRTGALLASILGYDYENWTDVDGIYSADPRIVGDAIVAIPEITIEEIREGANGGAAVLMGDTIFDLHKSSITTTVKNTFNPQAGGTRVLQRRTAQEGQPIVGVAGHDDLVKLEIRRFGMNKISGYVHRLLAHFSSEAMSVGERISIEYLPMGIDALSVAVRTNELTPQQKKQLDSLPASISADKELAPDNTPVWIPCAVVYLVGQGLLDKQLRTQVHHRATGALIKDGLYFEDDVSDAGSPSIAFLMDRESMKPAINTLHKEFFLKN